MNLIERYILGRTARLSLMTLAATTVIVIITQVLNYVNVLTDSGQSMATFAMLSLMLMPAMAVVVLPFAILIGSCQTLMTMNADSELAVVEAAGGSQKVTAMPVVAFGLAMGVLTLGAAHVVEPWSNRQMRDIVSAASADLLRFAVTTGTFKELQPKLYVQIAEPLPGGAFGGVFIADIRDDKTDLLYYAKKGAIVPRDTTELLVLQEGEVHRKSTESGETSIIRFASYALDFTQFGPSGKAATYYPKERTTVFLFNPDPNDHFAVKLPHMIRSEIHRRFSEWLYPVTFALIAAYFVGTARSNRQERFWSVAGAATVALALRALGFISMNNSGTSTVFAVLVYAAPLGAIGIFLWLLATGRQLRIPQRFVEWAAALAASADQARLRLLLRLRGHSGQSAERRG